MVARYKKKRLAEEMSHDSPPKSLKLEGAERLRGKREVNEQVKEAAIQDEETENEDETTENNSP